MKLCPKCQNRYTDETLQFCLQDGTQLVETVNKQSDVKTVSFEGDETVITNRQSERVTFDLSDSNETNWEESQATKVSTFQNESSDSNTLRTILLTGLVMFLLFGIGGFGAWVYFNNQPSIVQNNGSSGINTNKTNVESGNGLEVEENTKSTPTPTPKVTPTKTPKPTPTPDQNPEKTKKDVSDKIYNWKSMAEARNLNAYMNNYASRIDYYNRKRASKSFVKKDKAKAFNKYTSIKSTISNMNVKPSVDGKTAVATFDKEWLFSNDDEQNSGKVISQLKLKRIEGKWFITAEKDLKVYYVNK